MQIIHLGVVYTLVVDLRQGVQLFPDDFEAQTLLLVLDGGQLSQVCILWMQGIDTDGIIRIGILPGVGDGGIVDREYLQHALLGLVAPVDEHFQVAKVAHAKAALTSQREDGDHRSCTLPGINREVSLREFVNHHVAFLKLG